MVQITGRNAVDWPAASTSMSAWITDVLAQRKILGITLCCYQARVNPAGEATMEYFTGNRIDPDLRWYNPAQQRG
jgi:hypothetical protein